MEKGTGVGIQIPMEEPEGDVAKSLEAMLKSQYTSREFRDVFASTELTSKECYWFAVLAMNRFVMYVLSTTQEDIDNENHVERKAEAVERLSLQRRLLQTPTAMVYAEHEAFMYFYALNKQSLNRQSRKEAVDIAKHNMSPYKDGSQVGFTDKLRARLLGGNRIQYKQGE